MAAVQHSRIYWVSLRVEDISAHVNDTLAVWCPNDFALRAGIVDKVVRVEKQIQIFGGLRKEERLHAVLLAVVADVLDL